MSILKDAGDSIVKYSELIVTKTEGYTRIAKLTLDIRKLNSDIEKLQAALGGHVIKKIEEGEEQIVIDSFISDTCQHIREIEQSIQDKKDEIELLKKDPPASHYTPETDE